MGDDGGMLEMIFTRKSDDAQTVWLVGGGGALNWAWECAE